ncbi:MAG: DUF5680 domain-containing protein [Clostridia bacterium]
MYHDTYFGGTNFIGEEVIYVDSESPIWGMNYYGVTLDKEYSEEAMDRVLRPALMLVGTDLLVLPVRGPSIFEHEGYRYVFKSEGQMEKFMGKEYIYKENHLIYTLHCQGGYIK